MRFHPFHFLKKRGLAAVLAGTLAAPLTVAAMAANGGQNAGKKQGRGWWKPRELTVPRGWTGQWAFSLEYRSVVSGNLLATEDAATAICPGDRLGLSSFLPARTDRGRRRHKTRRGGRRGGGMQEAATACTGGFDGDRLALACSTRVPVAGCTLEFGLNVEVGPPTDEDTIGGVGEWRLISSKGDCGVVLEQAGDLGEVVHLSGARASEDPGSCSAPPQSLIEKLIRHPGIMSALPPSIEDLSARTAGPTVHLAWTPGPDAVAYDVYRAAVDQPFRWAGRTIGRKNARFVDHPRRPKHRRFAGRPPGKVETFRYVVRWLDAEGRESPVSNEVRVTRQRPSRGGGKGGAR